MAARSVFISSGTAAPDAIDQFARIKLRAPARKNVRAHSDGSLFDDDPLLLPANTTTSAFKTVSFRSAGVTNPSLAFGASSGTETTIIGPSRHLRSPIKRKCVAIRTTRYRPKSAALRRRLVNDLP